MLESSNERVELLKRGISSKTIEKLYLLCNNFKIVSSPVLFEPDEVDALESIRNLTIHEVPAQYEEVFVH